MGGMIWQICLSSYVGAYQFGIDIGYMRSWLGEFVTDPEIRQTVLDLPVFKYLSGAVMILKKQPYRRGGSKFREPCSMEDLSMLFYLLELCTTLKLSIVYRVIFAL